MRCFFLRQLLANQPLPVDFLQHERFAGAILVAVRTVALHEGRLGRIAAFQHNLELAVLNADRIGPRNAPSEKH